MALTPQNDSGTVVGANAYIDVAFFKSYHDERGNVYSAADDVLGQKIILATDYLDERFLYAGQKLGGTAQTTEWPRLSAYDQNRLAILGIPTAVKEATAEYALRALTLASLNPDPDRDSTGATIQSKSEAVGPISESVTFVGGATFQMPKYPAADQKLRRAGLIRSGGTLLRA